MIPNPAMHMPLMELGLHSDQEKIEDKDGITWIITTSIALSLITKEIGWNKLWLHTMDTNVTIPQFVNRFLSLI